MPVTASDVHTWLFHRSKTELYTLCCAIVISAWLSFAIGRHLWLWVQSQCNRNLWCSIHIHLPRHWKYFLFISVPRVFSWLDIASCHQALAVSTLSAANIVVLTLGADSWATTQRRAGNLAVIHMIPLCTGFNFGFPANLLLVDRQALAWVHRWIGRLFLMHSILHGSLIVSPDKIPLLATPQYILPITVSCYPSKDIMAQTNVTGCGRGHCDSAGDLGTNPATPPASSDINPPSAGRNRNCGYWVPSGREKIFWPLVSDWCDSIVVRVQPHNLLPLLSCATTVEG